MKPGDADALIVDSPVYVDEPVAERAPEATAGAAEALPRRGLLARATAWVWAVVGWTIWNLWGLFSLLIVLAIVAAIPIVNFVALGYLIEVEGRVARSGRFRDAFPLLGVAPRLGTILAGVGLWLLVLVFFVNLAADARLIAPGSAVATRLQWLSGGLNVAVAIHLALALARGGTIWTFLNPVANVLWLRRSGGDRLYWREANEAVSRFFHELRIFHHFWLGVRGFVGAMIWLAVPTALLAAGNKSEPGPVLVSVGGGLLLVLVLSWVPLLQAHFAAENRFTAWFELSFVRSLALRAPFTYTLAVAVTLVLALPMYLFKIVLPPQDAAWLVTIVFILSIYPARVLTGWAYALAQRRPQPLFVLWRWVWWIVMGALLVVYVFLLFLTPAVSAHGRAVLFEHHPFLLPTPG